MDYVKEANLLGNKKVIVGDTMHDLVLENLGRIYIRYGNSYKEFNSIINSIETATANPKPGKIIVEKGDLKSAGYYKEGQLIFHLKSGVLYLCYDLDLLYLVQYSEAKLPQYVSKKGDTMTGQLVINTGKAPLIVQSSKLVNNFNANYLEGYLSNDFGKKYEDDTIYGDWTFKGKPTFEKTTKFTDPVTAIRVGTGALITDGNIGSSVFVSGYNGQGWMLDASTNTLTIDNLIVRGVLLVFELVVNKISATNGSFWITDSFKVKELKTIKFINVSEYSNTLKVSDGLIEWNKETYYIPYVDLDGEYTDDGLGNNNSITRTNSYPIYNYNSHYSQDRNNNSKYYYEKTSESTEDWKLLSLTNAFKVCNSSGELSQSNTKSTEILNFIRYKYLFKINNLSIFISENIKIRDLAKESTLNNLFERGIIEKIYVYQNIPANASECELIGYIEDREEEDILKDNDDPNTDSEPTTEEYEANKNILKEKLISKFDTNFDKHYYTIIPKDKAVLTGNEYLYDINDQVDINLYYKYFGNTTYENNLYILESEHDLYPVFKPGDILRCLKFTGTSVKQYHGIVLGLIGEYGFLIQIQRNHILNQKTEYVYDEDGNLENYYVTTDNSLYDRGANSDNKDDSYATPAIDDALVRIGSIFEGDRQNSMYLTSSEDYSPYQDILTGVNRPDYTVNYLTPKYILKTKVNENTEETENILGEYELDESGNKIITTKELTDEEDNVIIKYVAEIKINVKVRLGNLSGIHNELYGTRLPKGFGLYGENVYLTGEFYLNNGRSLMDVSDTITLAVGNIDKLDTDIKLSMYNNNLIKNSDFYIIRPTEDYPELGIKNESLCNKYEYTFGEDYSQIRGKTLTLSLDFEYSDVLPALIDSEFHHNYQRLGTEISIKYSDNSEGTTWFGLWEYPETELNENGVEVYTNNPKSFTGRLSKTITVKNTEIASISGRIYALGITFTSIKMGRPKLEYGSVATRWGLSLDEDIKNEVETLATNVLETNKSSLIRLGYDYNLFALGSAGMTIINPNVTYDENGLVDESTIGDGDEYISFLSDKLSINNYSKVDSYYEVLGTTINPENWKYKISEPKTPYDASEEQIQFNKYYVSSFSDNTLSFAQRNIVTYNNIDYSFKKSYYGNCYNEDKNEINNIYYIPILKQTALFENGKISADYIDVNKITAKNVLAFDTNYIIKRTYNYDAEITYYYDYDCKLPIVEKTISGSTDNEIIKKSIYDQVTESGGYYKESIAVKINPNFDFAQEISDDNYPILNVSNNLINKDSGYVLISGARGILESTYGYIKDLKSNIITSDKGIFNLISDVTHPVCIPHCLIGGTSIYEKQWLYQNIYGFWFSGGNMYNKNSYSGAGGILLNYKHDNNHYSECLISSNSFSAATLDTVVMRVTNNRYNSIGNNYAGYFSSCGGTDMYKHNIGLYAEAKTNDNCDGTVENIALLVASPNTAISVVNGVTKIKGLQYTGFYLVSESTSIYPDKNLNVIVYYDNNGYSVCDVYLPENLTDDDTGLVYKFITLTGADIHIRGGGHQIISHNAVYDEWIKLLNDPGDSFEMMYIVAGGYRVWAVLNNNW